jgi:hypothetical protein
MSTVALQSDIATRWISANGTLVNLLSAGIFWLLLRWPRSYSPAMRYFLVLTMAVNLFTGTGYFFFSGVTNFGDWAEVIRGLEPHWMWRTGLVVIGIASYYASMLLVAQEMRPFMGRLRALVWTPYIAEGILAALGGLLNPAGLFYVIASALPSTLGANAGLPALMGVMHGWKFPGEDRVSPIIRSIPWITVGLLASLLFVFVLGKGVTFQL